jgi:DNA-binding NtrC family response regulator
MERGAFDYLVKPVQLEELVYRIQDAYKARMLKQSTPVPAAGEADEPQ